MTKWLTTGQMIDRLKIGEIVEDDLGNLEGQSYVKRNIDGFAYYRNKAKLENKDGEDFVLSNFQRRKNWRILPKYVTFEDAMKVHKEERKAVVFHEGNGNCYEFREGEHQMFGFIHDYKFTLMHLIKGQWSIED